MYLSMIRDVHKIKVTAKLALAFGLGTACYAVAGVSFRAGLGSLEMFWVLWRRGTVRSRWAAKRATRLSSA